MTEKPYTDADVELVAVAMWRAGAPERHSRAEVARIALDALAAAGRLAPVDDDPRHIIQFRTDGWTIKHPLACRPNLFDCPVNRAAEAELGTRRCPPAPPGRYECRAGEGDLAGMLLLGDRVDQSEG
jgi:hypothetical protein